MLCVVRSNIEGQGIAGMRGRALAIFLLQAGEQLGMDQLVFASGGDPKVIGLDFARIAFHQVRKDLLFALELSGVGQAIELWRAQLVFDDPADSGRWFAAGQGGLIGPGDGCEKEK
jgi:hypothetical protein